MLLLHTERSQLMRLRHQREEPGHIVVALSSKTLGYSWVSSRRRLNPSVAEQFVTHDSS